MEEKILRRTVNYNALCAKHGVKYRVRYMMDDDRLVLGRQEQFDEGVYQCTLAKGMEDAVKVLEALTLTHCSEYGE